MATICKDFSSMAACDTKVGAPWADLKSILTKTNVQQHKYKTAIPILINMKNSVQ